MSNNDFNFAQSLIYSRSNIKRTFSDFDDTDIAGIYAKESELVIVRNDGTEQQYPINPVKEQYKSFTGRFPNFFAYMGPNNRGLSLWKNNAYIIFKGHNYSYQGSKFTSAAQLQTRFADKLCLIQTQEQVEQFLADYDLGYLISPDGLIPEKPKFNIFSTTEQIVDNEEPKPYCSCGSFQGQLKNLDQFSAELGDYQPTCKHHAWVRRYRTLLSRRAELISNARGSLITKATAWIYSPPKTVQDKGRFLVIYTDKGHMATADKWRLYKPGEKFTEDDVWDLFESMVDNGFVPYPVTAMPHLNHLFDQFRR